LWNKESGTAGEVSARLFMRRALFGFRRPLEKRIWKIDEEESSRACPAERIGDGGSPIRGRAMNRTSEMPT